MATVFEMRVLLLAPAARVAAWNAWIASNLDETGVAWLVNRLSATGQAPATHAWCSVALTALQYRLVVQRLCALSAIAFPIDWDTKTRGERKAWLLAQREGIDLATGITFQCSDNDGVWDDPRERLQAKGLQEIRGS